MISAEEKTRLLREAEQQIKERDELLVTTISQAIQDDLSTFHALPDHLRCDKDIVKAVIQKVGAEHWFATEGLVNTI